MASLNHERARAYVAIPADKQFDPIYAAIRQVAQRAGLGCVRASDVDDGGPLKDKVLTAIRQAGLVIGVMTRNDPDVPYEIGFAQLENKETIVLADQAEAFSADLRRVSTLSYSPTRPADVAPELYKWVTNSHVMTSDLLTSSILRRGDVFETVVDGTFYLQRVRPLPSKAEIKDYLTQGAMMPQRLLYLTEEGQTTYLALCEDRQYRYFQETIEWIGENAPTIVDCVLDRCGVTEVDFISLGPGNGRKDAVLLSEFLRRAEPLRYTYYYPYDVSGGLLLEAMRNIYAQELPLDQLRVKAIEADIRYLREFKKVFDYRPDPNVYSLLGGLANMATETELLTMLKRVMNPADTLLIETRKKADARMKGLGRQDLNRRLDLAPLKYVHAEVEPSSVVYEDVTTSSSVGGTRTVAARVPEVKLDRETYKDVSLFPVHYYEPDSLEGVLQEIGFEILADHEQPNSLFYVCALA